MTHDQDREKRLLCHILQDEDHGPWKERVRRECLTRMGEHRVLEKGLVCWILEELGYRDFRVQLRARCLKRLVPRRSRERALRLVVAASLAIAVLVVLSVIYVHTPGPLKTMLPEGPDAARLVVKTRPLAPRHGMRASRLITIRTRKVNRFSGASPAKDRIVHTDPKRLEVVPSAHRSQLRQISDRELLAMFGPRACGLIRTGPSEKRLLLYHGKDRNRLFQPAPDVR